MKLRYTCFLYLLLFSITAFSQQANKKHTGISHKSAASFQPGTKAKANATSDGAASGKAVAYGSPLTGVWRGFFTSGMGFFQEKYRYEVQIGQLSNNGIKGVTYSYKTTVFYGKAGLAGMFTPSTKNVVLKENKLMEVKMSNGDDACLMTCYLEYNKIGNVEILEGTFTSVNIKSKADCGSGRVYLEKVPESDFYKEDFLKEYEEKKKTTTTIRTNPPRVVKKTVEKPKTTVVKKKPEDKPKVVRKEVPVIAETPSPRKPGDVIVRPMEEPKSIPRELKERENKVAKLIVAEGDEILIQLFDNGQIDDDTISVYHNKQVVASRKRLCHQPISIRIKVDPRKPRNEFVMVAENLGSIPPNTALMIITVGKQRHEVFLTSTEQKNAMVVVECRPPSEEGK